MTANRSRRPGWLAAAIVAAVSALALVAAGSALAQEPPPTHTVRAGDTLTDIARRHATTVEVIAAENGILNPDRIYVGQVLRLPLEPEGGGSAAITHVVSPGETLTAIAERYGSTPAALARTNRLLDPNRIYAGQRLLVPTGTGTTSVAVEPATPVAVVCEAPRWTIRYPAGWHVNDPARASDACRWFDREPFEVAPAAETFTDVMIAVVALTVDESIARLVDGDFAEVLSQRETVVDGRRAVALESVRTRDLTYPEGTRSFRYLVDLDGETLEVVTYGTAGRDYAGNRGALERMVATLDVR